MEAWRHILGALCDCGQIVASIRLGRGGHTGKRVERPFAMAQAAWFADPGAILVMAVRAAGPDLAHELSPWVRYGSAKAAVRPSIELQDPSSDQAS